MTETKVADRYAKALLLFVQETNSTDIVLKDLEFILESLNNSPEFYLFTTNPIIRPHKKIEIFNEMFKNQISEITLGFIILLTKKNREGVLKFLIYSFIDQYNELNNRVRVDIVSGKELSNEIQNTICDKLHKFTGKTILPKFNVDSRIIGGFQARFADYFYDASIKKQLENLLTEFSK
jgi:F-type H+-transporting ATPase subunit delta